MCNCGKKREALNTAQSPSEVQAPAEAVVKNMPPVKHFINPVHRGRAFVPLRGNFTRR